MGKWNPIQTSQKVYLKISRENLLIILNTNCMCVGLFVCRTVYYNNDKQRVPILSTLYSVPFLFCVSIAPWLLDERIKCRILRRCRMINSIIRQWKKDTENDLSKNKLSSAFSIWAHNVVDFFPWTIMSFCRGKAKLYLSNDKKQSRKTQKKREKNNLSLFISHSNAYCTNENRTFSHYKHSKWMARENSTQF